MIRHDLPEAQWRRSSYSMDNGGNCVEVRAVAVEAVACRDSKDPALGTLLVSAGAWAAFVGALGRA
jgi:hypothetical protein